MDLAALATLQPTLLRELLPSFLSGYLVGDEARATNHRRVADLVNTWSDETCQEVLHHLLHLGEEHRVYPPHLACRTLSRVWSRDAMTDTSVSGVEHLKDALSAGPTLILANHQAYYDSSAVDAILAWNGHTDLADRLVSAAGPKVYAELFRRVAASCLFTLPVPQSTTFAHTEQLSRRELAERAIASLNAAREAVTHGQALLLYAEGSRTRTGRMGTFLKAVHRYVGLVDGLQVVPAALSGTGALMPVGDERIHPGPVNLTFAPPLVVGPDLSPRDALEAAYYRIAERLPADQQPAPDTPAVG